ncbi:Nose resistant-to-fluoxetine protein N-terminal domain-containing protein [Caenorhabditis elegans]|uniref:Nose resistant-to-fluoxetine protein N-terminal domain-containing protein n=1 Tax=Caenorhabditis elegans TaxID=6239 RepID=Q23054_CAEEL|nr:Nose resistant-to-fluoxetine protein N-terminal domain-containing protein [Caenorhabditis elegans]CCD65666.2 Nose resistant-to-fluoxetine protein N-terminal domain-containing protein [Caenorhabditis elegans]|eukprot:NP_001309487.1 O-ACyltransferase homolog [Caenorhabditis elegans]
MCLIFCRFVIIFWILLQIEGVVVNDSRIQALLLNSSFSIEQLDYRNKNEIRSGEVATPDLCKTLMKRWFQNLNSLKNGTCKNSDDCLDALDQLDAFARYPAPGSPNIYDGSFRKCNDLNEKGGHRRKYCYLIQADEKMNCREEYHSILFKPNRTAFGFCGPEICHGKDYASMFGSMEKTFHFLMDRPVCAAFCTVRDIPKKLQFYFFTAFLIMLGSVVFFSSLYDYVRDTRYRLSSESEKVFGQRIILSFSLWSNIEFIFQDKRPDYIRSLDCIRAITFTWVVGQNVVGHLGFYDDKIRVDPSKISLASSAMSSLLPIYTYLFMSGLTVSYTFLKGKPSLDVLKQPFTWLIFFFHRWIRLTSALMVFIGFFDAYGKYIQGPYDALTGYSMVTQTDLCTYWMDIIHISNFVAVDEMCYLPAWHLAVDFQFTIFAPFFLLAFHYSTVLGTILAIIASLIGSGLTVFFFLQNTILNSAFTGDHVHDDKLVEIILSKPWNQMAPYMMGMIAGCILGKHSGSKRIIHPVASSIIWIIITVLGLVALIFGHFGTSQLEKALTNVSTRAVWSICLMWIIISTELKSAGPIGHYLEHPFWRPFGKLSFCAFIVHHMLLYFLFNIQEEAPKYTSFWHEYFHYTIPIVIYSYFLAFFLSVVVEIPILRIDRLIIDQFVPVSKIEKKTDVEEDDSFKDTSNRSDNTDGSSKKIKKSPENQETDYQSRNAYSPNEPLLENDLY